MTWPVTLIVLAVLAQVCHGQAAAQGAVVPIVRGQPAPGDGYFVPRGHLEEALAQSAELRKLLATHDLEVASMRAQSRIAVETALEEGKIQIEAEREKARIEIEALRIRLAAVEAENERLKNPPWWKSPDRYRLEGVLSFLIPTLLLALLF